MFIGKKIKEFRKQNGLTLVQLSAQSGVQVATLSRIENLKMPGTLESHMAIAKALNVDITCLYSEIITEDKKKEMHAPRLHQDVFVHSDKSSLEILTSHIFRKKMMPIMLKIEVDGKTNEEENASGTEKFVYVLAGSIEVKMDDNSFPLTKGNSFYFDASHRHQIINRGKATSKVLCIATPPTY